MTIRYKCPYEIKKPKQNEKKYYHKVIFYACPHFYMTNYFWFYW